MHQLATIINKGCRQGLTTVLKRIAMAGLDRCMRGERYVIITIQQAVTKQTTILLSLSTFAVDVKGITPHMNVPTNMQRQQTSD